MNVRPVNYNVFNKTATNDVKPVFRHGNPWSESGYTLEKKTIVAGTTALGVGLAIAGLAKHAGYSLKPSRMFKNFKKSYLYKAPYNDEAPILAIGAGSCTGGLAGGYLIDKNKDNRIAKLKETLLQVANISLPAIFTVRFAKTGQYLGKRFLEKDKFKITSRTKVPQAVAAMAGLLTGVFVSNVVANKINEKIFHKGKGRPVQLSDFSAHLDDFCLAAKQFDTQNKIISPVVHGFSMAIPAALMVAGNEIGNKTAE